MPAITDPALIAELEAAGPTALPGKPIDDPALLTELNRPGPTTGQVLGEGAVRGMAGITHLIGEAGRWLRLPGGPAPDNPAFGSREAQEAAGREAGIFTPPEAKTPTQRVLQAAAEAGTGSLPFGAATVAPMAAGGAAGEVAGQVGAGALPQLGITLLTALGISPLQNRVVKTGRAIAGASRENPAIAAMDAEGVVPRIPGAVTDSATVNVAESGLSKSFGGAGTMADAAKRTIAEIDAAVERTAGRVGSATTPKEAGYVAQKGIGDWQHRFRDEHARLLAKVKIADDDRIPITAWEAEVAGFKQKFGSDAELAAQFENPKLAAWLKAAQDDYTAALARGEPPGVRWGTLRAIRTEIGSMINEHSLTGDVRTGELKRLYGALTEDLRYAAATAGPDTLKAFERANAYYRAGSERIEQSLSRLYNARIPEAAYNLALAGQGKNVSDLWALKRSLQPDEWGMVSSAVLRNLGRRAEGADFDMPLFLRRWQAMPQGAKDALFSGNGPQWRAYSASVNRLALIAKTSEKATSYSNNPGIAGNLMFMGILGAAGGTLTHLAAGDASSAATTGLATTAGAILAPRMAAQLMSSPAFVRWLATPTGAGQVQRRMLALSTVVRQEPHLEDAVRAFVAQTATLQPGAGAPTSQPPTP